MQRGGGAARMAPATEAAGAAAEVAGMPCVENVDSVGSDSAGAKYAVGRTREHPHPDNHAGNHRHVSARMNNSKNDDDNNNNSNNNNNNHAPHEHRSNSTPPLQRDVRFDVDEGDSPVDGGGPHHPVLFQQQQQQQQQHVDPTRPHATLVDVDQNVDEDCLTEGSSSEEQLDDEEDEEYEEEEEDDVPVVVTQWRCPQCSGNVNLHVELVTESTQYNDDGFSAAAAGATAGEENADNACAGSGSDSDAGDAASGCTSPSGASPRDNGKPPEIGEVGFVPTTFKEKAWLCIEITDTVCPPYHNIACGVVLLGLVFVLLSVVIFLLESYPRYYKESPSSFYVMECVCIGYFTIELIARAAVCPDWKKLLKEYFTWIDILSVVPFYIAVFAGSNGEGLPTIRVLRLLRIFRIFKLTKYNEVVHVVVGSLRKSSDGLYMLIFFLLNSVVFFSSAVYFVEREYNFYDPQTKRWWTKQPWEEGAIEAPFQSITHAFWWAFVTLTTVGYGNEIPYSPGGRVVAGLAMLCGTLVIAFPMVIIGQNFQDMYANHVQAVTYRKKRLKAHLRKQRAEKGEPEGSVAPSSAEAEPPPPKRTRSKSMGLSVSQSLLDTHANMGTPVALSSFGSLRPSPSPALGASVLAASQAHGHLSPRAVSHRGRRPSAAQPRQRVTLERLNDLEARLEALAGMIAELEGDDVSTPSVADAPQLVVEGSSP